MKNNIIKKIEDIIGKKNVLLSSEDKNKYLTEWRNRYPGKARAVLRPKSTKEVSLLLKLFHQKNIPVTPQGGNTGLVGGQITYSSKDFIISLERMNKLINFNKVDETIIVQAGMLLTQIHNICDENDMFFPLSLASEGSCTIGGNLATNAGGVGVLYYGNTRDLTLGLEIVLSDGRRCLMRPGTGSLHIRLQTRFLNLSFPHSKFQKKIQNSMKIVIFLH